MKLTNHKDPYVQTAIERGAWFEHAINGVTMGPDRAKRQALVSKFLVGQELTLQRDPENTFDPNAIKIMTGRSHVGFVSAKDVEFFGQKGGLAGFLSPRIRDGEKWRCFVQAVVGGSGSRESFGCRIILVMQQGADFSFDSHYPLGEKEDTTGVWPEESEAGKLAKELFHIWPKLSVEQQAQAQEWLRVVKKMGGAPASIRDDMRAMILKCDKSNKLVKSLKAEEAERLEKIRLF